MAREAISMDKKVKRTRMKEHAEGWETKVFSLRCCAGNFTRWKREIKILSAISRKNSVRLFPSAVEIFLQNNSVPVLSSALKILSNSFKLFPFLNYLEISFRLFSLKISIRLFSFAIKLFPLKYSIQYFLFVV